MRLAKASPSIVASAIIAIIGSLLVILFAGVGFLGTLFARTGPASMPQPPGIRAMSMFFVAVICAFGILGIFSAVGIWRLQNWARLSFLIYSGVMVLMCVLVVA